MSIIGWVVLGLIAGWIGSKIVKGRGSGFFLNIVLGIVGAFVGGIIFSAIGGAGVTYRRRTPLGVIRAGFSLGIFCRHSPVVLRLEVIHYNRSQVFRSGSSTIIPLITVFSWSARDE